jgi:hypothetical protein
MKIQKEAWEMAKRLQELQIDILKAKEARLSSGKSLITIDSTGLEPSLEMILWQVLQKVQIKANEESANFLLGIK